MNKMNNSSSEGLFNQKSFKITTTRLPYFFGNVLCILCRRQDPFKNAVVSAVPLFVSVGFSPEKFKNCWYWSNLAFWVWLFHSEFVLFILPFRNPPSRISEHILVLRIRQPNRFLLLVSDDFRKSFREQMRNRRVPSRIQRFFKIFGNSKASTLYVLAIRW